MSLSDYRFIAPPHAPFTRHGDLNLETVERQASFFSQHGVKGVFVSGSTGECASLTDDERIALTRRWTEVVSDHELEVIAQVGHNCRSEAIALAADAQRVGVDAIAALAPCYFKPESVDDLIDFLAPVAAAAGDTPFYFYDIPTLTNVRLPMVDFLVRGKQRMPNLVGLKYTNPDLLQLQECVQLEDGEFEILFGCDEILLAGAALGTRGAVGSCYNFAAGLFQHVIDALLAGDWQTAQQQQARAVRLIRIMQRHGFLAACKAAMSLFGIDCGPVRSPLRALNDEALRQLRVELEALEIFQLQRHEDPRSESVPRR